MNILFGRNLSFWKRFSFLLLGFLVSFLLVVFFTINRLKSEKGVIENIRLGKADVGIGGFSFLQNQEGEVQWEVKAKKAEVYKENHLLFLRDVQASFISPDGEWIRLEGETGQMDTQARDFFLVQKEGLVKVKLSNGVTILTERLDWSNSKNEISSNDNVQIMGPGFEIRGVGLTANVYSQEVRIHQDVRAFITGERDSF
ncbi:MAG TPA: LPS export ABC transporter periplasmic protein LptC [Nitrospiria bacterium]